MKFTAFSIGLIPFLAVGFNLAFSKPSYAWLEVCNDHGETLYFSVAAQHYAESDDNRTWSTWGTWELPPNDCYRTLNNDLRSDFYNNFYYYAYTADHSEVWQGDRRFCVSSKVGEGYAMHFNSLPPSELARRCDSEGGTMVRMKKFNTSEPDYHLHLR